MAQAGAARAARGVTPAKSAGSPPSRPTCCRARHTCPAPNPSPVSASFPISMHTFDKLQTHVARTFPPDYRATSLAHCPISTEARSTHLTHFPHFADACALHTAQVLKRHASDKFPTFCRDMHLTRSPHFTRKPSHTPHISQRHTFE
jgi:hypothetical protein